MTDTKGKVVGVNGNMVSVEFDGNISMNEVAYVKVDNSSLKSEVIRIRGNVAQLQVYEMTQPYGGKKPRKGCRQTGGDTSESMVCNRERH